MTNPNPMNSRCGLADCDCEYTIGGLLRRLELIMGNCTAGLHPSQSPRDKDAVFRWIHREASLTVKQTRAPVEAIRPLYHPAACPCPHVQAMECDSSCLCYVAGSEEDRQPQERD